MLAARNAARAAARSATAARAVPTGARALHVTRPVGAAPGAGAPGDSDKPGLFDTVKAFIGITKQHARMAAKNQKQAWEDVTSGSSTVKDTGRAHGAAMKDDVKQWGAELKESAQGNIPGSARVRDVPPRAEGQPVTAGDVKQRPLNAPASGPGAPHATKARASTGGAVSGGDSWKM